jgi:hypothetical protein
LRLPRGYSWISVAGVGAMVAVLLTVQHGQADGRHDIERHLFVWAGDQARARPDFLAVVDFESIRLSVLDLGIGSGLHYLALTHHERRLGVSDYFLNEDTFGKVHQEGDHKVHVARVTRHSLRLDASSTSISTRHSRAVPRDRTGWP